MITDFQTPPIQALIYGQAQEISVLIAYAQILLARTCVRKISSVVCGFSPIQVHFSNYLKGERYRRTSNRTKVPTIVITY